MPVTAIDASWETSLGSVTAPFESVAAPIVATLVMAIKKDIELLQGDFGRPLVVRVVDKATQQPLEITGTVEWAIAPNPGGAPIVYKHSVGGGVEIADQTSSRGYFAVVVMAADTAGLDPGAYYHEARLTQGGVSTPIVFGALTLSPSALL